MAQYTLTVKQLVENKIEIFDFSYPFYKEEARKDFEKHFIEYFYFEEIGHETVGRWKHALKVKLNTVMPFYNKLYETQEMEQRILDNYDVTETFERNTSNKNNGVSNSSNKELYKSAPKVKIDIDKIDVVDSINKNENLSNNTSNNEGVEKWERTMKGNIGVQTDSDAIIKYWSSLRKVTEELFKKELSELFMGVY